MLQKKEARYKKYCSVTAFSLRCNLAVRGFCNYVRTILDMKCRPNRYMPKLGQPHFELQYFHISPAR